MRPKPCTSLRDLLETRRLARTVFVGGKGGAGKTSTAAGLSIGLARQGRNCLLVSSDPAHSLFDVLGCGRKANSLHDPWLIPLGDDQSLAVLELQPDKIAGQHLNRVKRNIARFLAPKLLQWMERQIELAAAAPGTVEAALTEQIADLLLSPVYGKYRHIIFDTAPTGHTLQFLHMPEVFSAWVDGLLSSRKRAEKLSQVARSLRSKSRSSDLEEPDSSAVPETPEEIERQRQISAVLQRRRRLLQGFKRILQDPEQCHFLLVLNAEALPVQESLRTDRALEKMQIYVLALVVNRILPDFAQSAGGTGTDELQDFFRRQKQREQQYLQQIAQSFPRQLPRVYQRYYNGRLEGPESLLQLFGSGVKR